jgi:hypothetical protein
MYENGKMRHETILGIEGEIKGNDVGGEFNYNIL